MILCISVMLLVCAGVCVVASIVFTYLNYEHISDILLTMALFSLSAAIIIPFWPRVVAFFP
jgi:hypothetical protein